MMQAPSRLPRAAAVTMPGSVIELLPATTRSTAGGITSSLGSGTTELSSAIRNTR
jgi:hypothetical protein